MKSCLRCSWSFNLQKPRQKKNKTKTKTKIGRSFSLFLQFSNIRYRLIKVIRIQFCGRAVASWVRPCGEREWCSNELCCFSQMKFFEIFQTSSSENGQFSQSGSLLWFFYFVNTLLTTWETNSNSYLTYCVEVIEVAGSFDHKSFFSSILACKKITSSNQDSSNRTIPSEHTQSQSRSLHSSLLHYACNFNY